MGACAAYLAAGSGCALKTQPDTSASASSAASPAPASAFSTVRSLGTTSQPSNDTAQLTASSGPRSRKAADTVLLISVPAAGNGRAARVLPDVSDDEIVVRRLKQAAEAETDPELRARLWREYAIYAGGGTER